VIGPKGGKQSRQEVGHFLSILFKELPNTLVFLLHTSYSIKLCNSLDNYAFHKLQVNKRSTIS
jgi:hypothetical protein